MFNYSYSNTIDTIKRELGEELLLLLQETNTILLGSFLYKILINGEWEIENIELCTTEHSSTIMKNLHFASLCPKFIRDNNSISQRTFTNNNGITTQNFRDNYSRKIVITYVKHQNCPQNKKLERGDVTDNENKIFCYGCYVPEEHVSNNYDEHLKNTFDGFNLFVGNPSAIVNKEKEEIEEAEDPIF